MNFGNFQIQNWISKTVRCQKSRWGKSHLSSFLFFFRNYGPYMPKVCKFVLTSGRNLNLFKKLYLSERPRHALSENTKKVLFQQKINKIHQLQTLISSKLLSHSINNNHFLSKEQNENFQMRFERYLNYGDESCEITILSRLIQETYTSRKVKNQVLLFVLSWE